MGAEQYFKLLDADALFLQGPWGTFQLTRDSLEAAENSALIITCIA